MGVVSMRNVSDYVLSNCCMITGQTRPGIADEVLGWLRKDVEVKGHLFYVWQEGRFVRGFLKGKPDGTLDWLFVNKRSWGQGIGRSLLAMYERSMKCAGVRQISLHASPMVRTLKFYEKMGYVRQGDGYFFVKDISQNSR